jgi:hypothetical protein
MTQTSDVLADTTGEALRALEERLANARKEFFMSSADGAKGKQEAGVQEGVRQRMDLVFDAAEKILALARTAYQRKT